MPIPQSGTTSYHGDDDLLTEHRPRLSASIHNQSDCLDRLDKCHANAIHQLQHYLRIHAGFQRQAILPFTEVTIFLLLLPNFVGGEGVHKRDVFGVQPCLA
jgi:hypothetical protein